VFRNARRLKTARVHMYEYKHFIRALLINVAAPCRYAQSGTHLEINKPSTQNLKKLLGSMYTTTYKKFSIMHLSDAESL